MSEVSVKLPDSGNTYGVWLDNNGGDVHVYTDASVGVVIGQNVSYEEIEKQGFSDLAVSVTPEGKINFQYADEQKKLVMKELEPAVLKMALLDLLHKLRAQV
jgi:hypothetical protein